MKFRGKKYVAAKKTVPSTLYSPYVEAMDKVVGLAFAKFDETVSVDIVLGIDATKGDQVVRGSVLLPNGTGKRARVVAFVKADQEEDAKAAGADFVGYEDLIEKVLGGWVDFDYAITTPDAMAGLSKLAKVLGPRGLLPNKKNGTVTFDVKKTVTDLKRGLLSFRNDKGGGMHLGIGKVSFGVEKLKENFTALIKAVVSSKPHASRGKFIRKVTLASTQGVGVKVALDDGMFI